MLEIAVDIGGTFTDIVCLQDQQRLFLAKVSTMPHDLVQGMQQGVTLVLALAGQPATAVERFIYKYYHCHECYSGTEGSHHWSPHDSRIRGCTGD
jgi:hypothetical protein